jgi:hypothetical protein
MEGAAKAMLWVKVKVAAAVLSAAAVVGGGGVAAVKLAMDRPAPAFVQAAPAWVTDLAPGTWAAVSRNTPADVDPARDPALNPNHPGGPPWSANMGQVAVTASWNGGALATRWGAKGALLIYGGGGGNYFGNEVYAFDLEARLWSRITDPWRGTWRFGDTEAYPEGRFADGTPVVTSTYDQAEYHPGLNSFITLAAARNASGSHNVPTAYLLSLDSRTWRHSPRNERNHASVGGWSAYDSKRDVFWVEGGAGSDTFACLDPKAEGPDGSVGRWTNHGLKLNGSTEAVAAYDPVRDLVVVANLRDGSSTEDLRGVCAIDPGSPGRPAVRLRDQGTRPALDGNSGAAGWEWSHLRGAFLCWRRGADVLELRPPAGDWRTEAWTWAVLTDAAANRAEPEKMRWDNGVYGRFRIARYADAEVAVVINNMGGPVWAFRVPDPAGAGRQGR